MSKAQAKCKPIQRWQTKIKQKDKIRANQSPVVHAENQCISLVMGIVIHKLIPIRKKKEKKKKKKKKKKELY